ncbi:hypothetical protein NXT08_02035 [Rhodococcus pyridinivorans]|uniref:hypothetical protein n=1 Tax=Rhodococcus TaxID=1827 RepID=UPI000903A288|nr:MULTISPECIES: hypothetical protein [Rhodococcus]APE09228.1 hypothetical protein BO226_08400 [Rhodococcus sp. 2G]QXU55861.1 hypothetical protein KXC42_12195 [Rhodococcus sp. LW-XY12]UVT25468.1 hypothetical protein NXT08_02035 [Rhodococcus pyridinivorans]
MSSNSSVVALPGAPGHLIASRDNTVTLRTTAGTLLQVQNPPTDLLPALQDPASATKTACTYVQRLNEEVAERDTADMQARWPEARRAVILTGTGPIADDTADALRTWGATPSRFATTQELSRDPILRDETCADDPSLVISYADSPNERQHWGLLDAQRRPSVAWLRTYREGDVCFVDPLTLAAGDATADHVLRRRIAASLTPTAMTEWIHNAPGATTVPDTYARAMTVSKVLTVALAWAQQAPTLTHHRHTLWKLVPATGRTTEHPILGYEPPYLPDQPQATA